MSYYDQMRDSVTNLLQERYGLVAGAAAATTAAFFMWMTSTGDKAVEYSIDLQNQSVEIEPGVRTHKNTKDAKLMNWMFEDAKTVPEALLRGRRVSNNGPFLGTRSGPNNAYSWKTYGEIIEQSQQFGSGLVKLGLQPGEESFLGIFSPNRVEWTVAKDGCGFYSMVYVPLYDTLGTEACIFIINQTSMSFIVCDSVKKAKDILKMAEQTPTLKHLIVMDLPPGTTFPDAEKHKIEVLSLKEVQALGKANMTDPVMPQPSNLVTICYTSGTTGDPKGVMLTHENVISNSCAIIASFPEGMELIGPDDTHLCYLPLAHMFEGEIQVLFYQFGIRIGFSSGDVKLLLDDLQELRPTIFPVVPRLLNRIYDKVLQGVQGSAVKRFLYNLAIKRKTALIRRGVFSKDTIWDKLVFSKVQKLMGGNIRFCCCGSAPLANEVVQFARCALGCWFIEGYGQTEATAGITFTSISEAYGGHVGPPLPCNKVKLVDVPEMDYHAKDNKGEVCAKGPNIMRGYYKSPEKTREAIDEDGWLHTGDVGEWLPNGVLKIIDRKKHIFKLAQGEYLAPEKIEGIYVRSHFVAQAFIDGNSLQTFPVGIIVPDPEMLPGHAESKLGITGSMEELCKNETIKKLILEDLVRLGKEAGLKGFEQARAIHLHPQLFSVENNFLTPTFKAKRPLLRKTFAPQMDSMYQMCQ